MIVREMSSQRSTKHACIADVKTNEHDAEGGEQETEVDWSGDGSRQKRRENRIVNA